MDLNLYKIDNTELIEVKKDLKNSGYIETYLRERLEKFQYIMYVEKKISTKLSWLEDLEKIFPDINAENFQRENINMVIMLSLENYNLCLSFGQAFHKLDKYCDRNFGLDFAERSINNGDVKLKQSFYINSYKSKAIIDYSRESNDIRELGECIQLIQGKPATPKLGNKISCGSSVKFSISLKNRQKKEKIPTLENLNEFLKTVKQTYEGSKIKEYPRVRYLKQRDDFVLELTEIFHQAIVDHNNSEECEILFDSFYEKAAEIHFNFSDLEYEIKKNNEILASPSVLIKEEILELIYKNKKDIKKLNLQVLKDGNKLFEMKLLDIFSYVHFDELTGIYYLMINGRWVEFKQRFLDEVEEGINSIDFEVNNEFNILEYDTEEIYNKNIAKENRYELLDRKLFKGVEIGDLLSNNKELIHVKKHDNYSKLIYAIQQSMISANIILDQNLHDKLEEKYETIGFKFKNEKFSQCLLFLFNKKYFDNNFDLRYNFSKVRSIIFKLKLLSWHNFLTEKHIPHKVYLQYYEKKISSNKRKNLKYL